MLALPSSLHRRLRSEHGFTLMETLVAMVAGLLVAFAATMLMRVSLEQTERATDYVQASQLGRTAMNRIVDELNSACLSAGFTPVEAASTSEKLVFYDAFSKEAEIPNGQVQFHQIEWRSATSTLYDDKAIKNGENSSGYTHTEPEEDFLIGKHIVKSVNSGKEEPIFRYYEYNTEAKGSSEASVAPFTEIKLGSKALTAAEAEKVAAVQISFRALPNNGKESAGRNVDLRSQVTFAFSAPIAEPTITDGPCQ
jgi:prepilin-type N-terminal cleavage/methylation domain-containing protein